MRKLFKKELVIIGLLIALFLIIKFTPIYYIETREAPVYVVVGMEEIFDVKTETLDFGTVKAGRVLQKSLELSQTEGKPIKADIKISGPVAKWIDILDNSVLIETGPVQRAEFVLTVPEDTAIGAYEGKIKVVYRRTWQSIMPDFILNKIKEIQKRIK